MLYHIVVTKYGGALLYIRKYVHNEFQEILILCNCVVITKFRAPTICTTDRS